jgi:hypothetical protein
MQIALEDPSTDTTQDRSSSWPSRVLQAQEPYWACAPCDQGPQKSQGGLVREVLLERADHASDHEPQARVA